MEIKKSAHMPNFDDIGSLSRELNTIYEHISMENHKYLIKCKICFYSLKLYGLSRILSRGDTAELTSLATLQIAMWVYLFNHLIDSEKELIYLFI